MNLPKKRLSLFILFFVFLQIAGCKPSSSTTSTADPSVPSPGPTVTLSGTLTYDFVSAATGKLNYTGTQARPMRNVYVELLNASTNAVIASANTNDSGQYSMSVSSGSTVKLRIYAEMKTPPVIIQDNTNGSAEYALATSSFAINGNMNKDVRALSGWTGTNTAGSYSATRQAAPFAILDSIYAITKKIYDARPLIVYPLCRLNWSINNISASGSKASGQIGTSHFDPQTNQLYILGQADVDSDEYDNHVIVHEWGHFFESNLSRSDSLGGAHGSGDAKEMSLAFGEGWGNALSAMAFDPDVIYADTSGARQQNGFMMNLESGTDSNKGWFSEVSVQQILYDIYDNNSNNEANDGVAQGIGPIIDIFTGYEKTTPAKTSIFSFIYGLKSSVPAISGVLDTLVISKSITAITSPYGAGETHDAGWAPNLPLFNSLTLGAAAVPVTLYGDSGNDDFYGLYNTVFNNKYLRFTASSTSTRLTITSSDSFATDVYSSGSLIVSKYEERASIAAFGPFTYTVPTVVGKEYVVNILTDQDAVFDHSALVNVTVTGAAL